MIKSLTATFAAAALLVAPASATTFVFKGDGNNVTPNGVSGIDFDEDCASNDDICSIDHNAGLTYSLGGIDVQVRAFAGGDGSGTANLGDPTRLIQDRRPGNSGLGAFSETDPADDQTQFDSGEAIEFIFDREYTVKDVEFNAGGDDDCTATAGGGGEGPCGEILIEIFDIDDMLISSTVLDITNIDLLAVLGTGARFVLTALTPGAGFVVAQFTVIPVPGALPLLLSGLAGLGFAARRRKQAA
jgi:hypothetical protein